MPQEGGSSPAGRTTGPGSRNRREEVEVVQRAALVGEEEEELPEVAAGRLMAKAAGDIVVAEPREVQRAPVPARPQQGSA